MFVPVSLDTKDHSQGLVQNIRHLIFKVLGGNERVHKLLTALNHGVDFTTASSEVCIVVEGFPQVIDRLATGFGTCINQDTDFGLQHLADGVEEPTVRVNLLLVLSLNDQDDLTRDQVVGVIGLWENKGRGSIHRQLGGIL